MTGEQNTWASVPFSSSTHLAAPNPSQHIQTVAPFPEMQSAPGISSLPSCRSSKTSIMRCCPCCQSTPLTMLPLQHKGWNHTHLCIHVQPSVGSWPVLEQSIRFAAHCSYPSILLHCAQSKTHIPYFANWQLASCPCCPSDYLYPHLLQGFYSPLLKSIMTELWWLLFLGPSNDQGEKSHQCSR